MPTPFGSFPFDADGIDNFAHPQLIAAFRAPTVQDNSFPIGTQWADESTLPAVIYTYVGGSGGWETGGNAYATTTTPGIVTLSTSIAGDAASLTLVPTVKEIKDYVDAIAIAGAPISTTTVNGIGQLATDTEAVSGTATVPGVTALFVQPSNLAAVFAAPPATGGTTPAAGAFTTLGATGAITFAVGGSWLSGGSTMNLGTDASNDAINIGTAGARIVTIGDNTGATSVVINTGTGNLDLGVDAIAHTVRIGNATGATSIQITSGTGSVTLASTGTGDITANSADTLLLDSSGVLELNSSAGVISIGNDAVSQNINLGTAGTRLITIGNTTATTEVLINVGVNGLVADGVASSPYTIGASTTTGAITIGGTAQTTGIITLGSSSATSTVKIQSGAGASTTTIGEGTAGANVTSINNGATGASSTVNILSGAATAGTHAVNIFTGNASGGTQTFNLATGTNAVALNIGTGTTGVKTIAIGGTAANVITLGNTQTAGSVAIGNAMTTGTVTVGGTAGTGLITIGQATNATGQTVSINSGASIAGTNVVNVLAGATPAASQTFNLMTGVGSAGTYAINVLTGNSTGTTQTVSVGTGSARTDITLGGTGANVFAINNTTTTGTVAIGNAMTSGTITLGGTAGTGIITIGQATNATGQTISIASAASNTGANVVSILNGATPGANTTLNIMNGAGTAGTQTFNLLASGATRAGAVNIATGIAAHAVVIGQVTTTIAINGPTTHTLASGTAVGVTINTASGTGRGLSVTSSGVTVPDIASLAGGILVTPTDVSAGASPLTANNRHFKVVFNTVSIAASADQALTITNSTITGVNTDIMFTWSGTTTGSAVSLKSIVAGAGTVTLTFTNGAGATTSTSNITVIGWVMN